MAKNGYHKHGMAGTPTYRAWWAILGRCLNPRDSRYPNYGGRGITVCDHWLIFQNFYADMREKPDGKSIERINNDNGYKPGNCRWATQREQMLNTRRTSKITVNGVTKSVKEWAEQLGVDDRIIWKRLTHLGWTPEEAVTIPVSDTWTVRRFRATQIAPPAMRLER